MKKMKEVLSVLLTVCIFACVLAVPVGAAEGDGQETPAAPTEATVWKSSDYLNPDSPVTENNPWSVEVKRTVNNVEGDWEAVTDTEKAESQQALFPKMPDGNQPTTGYIAIGTLWEDGINAAVNGKYMIPASFAAGAGGDDVKIANTKIAKVFTVPKTGKIRISAAEGEIISNHITWADDGLAWIVSKGNGTEIWKKVYNDRAVGKSRDVINFDSQFIDVTEGEKLYFILQPRVWALRTELACIWDPVIAYTKSAEDTNSFLSSKYLNPEEIYDESNPWTVEARKTVLSNPDDANTAVEHPWEPVTGVEKTASDQDLFPQMPDSNKPTTGYITSHEQWGVGVNAAVDGKYMVPGSITATEEDAVKAGNTKIAKVFTAPKAGAIHISGAATMEGTDGLIVANKVAESWENEMQWSVEKDGSAIWSKTGANKTLGDTYDTVAFADINIEVKAGDKIYFVFKPRQYAARAGQACMWDPQVEYVTVPPITDKDRFVSSEYLNPDEIYGNSPWTFETKYSDDSSWVRAAGMVEGAADNANYSLFPQMPDGAKPTIGYIASGRLDGDGGWGVQGRNAAVNGKYMIPGFIYPGDKTNECAENPIAKVFTAPKDGAVKISAAATMDGEDGKLITFAKSGENTNGTRNTYSLVLGDDTLWSAGYAETEHEENYDSIKFDTVYKKVKTGDKLYFVYDPAAYAVRERSALMWDPVVEYGDFNIVNKAEYANGTVTVSFDAVNSDANATIIAAAYKDGTLVGCALSASAAIATNNQVIISNLSEKPDTVKIMTWEFSENAKMKPLLNAILMDVTEPTVAG